jgi:hypothetical protein
MLLRHRRRLGPRLSDEILERRGPRPVLMGALGACVVMIYGSDLPNGLVIFLSFIDRGAFGAIWG